MSTSFLKNRRTSIEAPLEEQEDIFNLLAKFYTESWLNDKAINPIQKLWQRKDEMATCELYTLGYSIQTLLPIDKNWVLTQIKKTKSLDQKNRQGAMFELCGLSILNGESHPVVPAKENQPGYDGILNAGAGNSMRISIKNYSISERQRLFQTKAAILEQDIVRLLKKYKYPPVTIMIDNPMQYPEKREWDLLTEHLDNIFNLKRNAKDNFAAITFDKTVYWTIIIQPMADFTASFHQDYNTYTCIVTSVYHPNEHINIFSKLEDACANLVKHSRNEDDNLINALLLHLPPSASLNKCYQWVQDYFDTYPNKPISLVILYQPAITIDRANNSTLIQHSCKFFIQESRFEKWNPNGLNFTFTIPVGRVSDSQPIDTIIAEYPDGHEETISIDGRYFYQRGEHYLKMKSDGQGGYGGVIQKLGSGLFTNVVIELPGQPGQATLGGRFAPSDELLIL